MVSRADRGALADWFWTIDRFFLATFILLMGIGFMLSFAASPPVAERIGSSQLHFVERHAVFSRAFDPGHDRLVVSSRPRQVRRAAIILLVLSIAMMVLALFFGAEIKGSRRWFSLGSFSVQPSEFLKPAFVGVCAGYLPSMHASLRLPEISLPSSYSHRGGASGRPARPWADILTSAVWGGMFFMAGMPWLWIILLGGLVLAVSSVPTIFSRTWPSYRPLHDGRG